MNITRTAIVFFALALSSSFAFSQTRTERTFEDWLVTCQETEAKKTCGMSQTLRDAKTNRTVLSWVIGKGTDDAMTAVIRTPTGVLLSDGLTISTVKNGPAVIAYRFCGPRACTAEFPFNEDWVDTFKQEADFSVAAKLVNGTPFSVKGSLKGFSDAYDFLASQ